MNKFNIPSILDEISRAFDEGADLMAGLIPAGEALWFDPATTSVRLLTRDEATLLRTMVAETMRKIADADVIIFTLGLVEMWRDRVSGLSLNTHPHPKAVRWEIGQRQEAMQKLHHARKSVEAARLRKEAPDPADLAVIEELSEADLQSRYEFLRPSHAELSAQMHEVVKLCQKVAPQAKLVVTISPVPLQNTMTPDDIVCSSTYSKSVLRVIAEEMRETYDCVEYFPSYEMVTNSPRHLTWEEDQVHVRADLVRQVTATFVQEWFEPAPSSD
jgi:hypothetical protein